MDYVTTNIRIPREVYEEIKQEAFEKKKSIGAVIRERVRKNKDIKKNTDKFMRELDKLAQENSKYFKGKQASDLLIEMRYEQ